ncbi:MAG: response regulator [Alphaproteobacteria bacterium]
MARILIAEDDRGVAEFVTRALIHSGHSARTVEDGLEALEALNEEAFDLLVSDIVMPGMDGIALALKVTKDFPAMRVLLMSGYAHERQRAHNLDALAHNIISKPFTLKSICAAVDKVLAVDLPRTA